MGRIAIASNGSASYYPDSAYNIQLSLYTIGGKYIKVSGASLGLYYKIIG